jgi:PAS domain S-box-containing protein
MTEVNARLRRQALILALLPDLVIVVDVQGKITFCSQQVENVLRHKIDDLIGAQLTEIMVPSSRDRFLNLIQELVDTQERPGNAAQNGKHDGANGKEQMGQQNASTPASEAKKKAKHDDDGASAARLAADANTVITDDSSFPMSVVQVAQTAQALTSSDENEKSDGSNSKQPSSITECSLGNSGSDDNIPRQDNRSATAPAAAAAREKLSRSSDSSNTSSSESAEAKNLLSANANLERNVRWHNMKMKDRAAQQGAGYKDDVLGAAVTANNATARLSSLQHRAESSSEEDSGYRESNESREDTSSSEGDNSSESNGKLLRVLA